MGKNREGPGLPQLDDEGRVRMVDVGDKPITVRRAVAAGRVRVSPTLAEAIGAGRVPKGDLLAAARLAGIQAAKRTAELIPLCHPLRLTAIVVELAAAPGGVGLDIRARVQAFDRTGVEMEALTAVAVAALTVYDMCKAIDRAMRLTEIRLVHKSGGKSGDFEA